jgi:hypothetical protein
MFLCMSNLIYIPTCFGQHVTIIRGLLFLGLATLNYAVVTVVISICTVVWYNLQPDDGQIEGRNMSPE